ncbi:MAG: class I tRNA ligase family protein, partial [Planctomycetota bacterium]
EEAYVTYHQSYVESVWWALKTLFDAGKLYQGHKIVWWWAQGGTALSAGEVGQGYREVDEPSVYVKCRLVDGLPFQHVDLSRASQLGVSKETTASLLVWTTTPWTLPSNTFVAVHRDIAYSLAAFGKIKDGSTGKNPVFEDKPEVIVVARDLLSSLKGKLLKYGKALIDIGTCQGADLGGKRYVPPFRELYYDMVPPPEMVAHYDHEPPPPGTFPAPYLKPWSEAKGVLKGETIPKRYVAWRVVHGDFVTLESGTGLVHEAPAFGEVDFELLKRENYPFAGEKSIPLLCPIGANGKFDFQDYKPLFNESAARRAFCEKYKGRWVKDCDKDLCKDMKERGVLVLQEQYRHDYPFCWRAEDDPLIQYPRRSWFVRTTEFKEDMLANNQRINWLPDHIKAGRFGKFLESNVDWALSRERYWGTPLPIWVCESCSHTEAIDSYDNLVSKPGVEGLDVWGAAKRQSPDLSDHLKVHKPYIDAITYDCPKCANQSQTDQSRDREGAVSARSQRAAAIDQGPLADARGSDQTGRMQRVPEVIDCWFDAGSMPFAQWGWPHQNAEMFDGQFPADFISEALDQTRGWFYSLTAISVMLFGPNGIARDKLRCALPATVAHPFQNCIVLGLLMGEDGQKMSKSKKNYKEPTYIFDHEGADAMRWLFFSGQTPWTSIRFQESTIAEGQREFLIRFYNCYSFFVIYANIDKWSPQQQPTADARADIDRWILSELAQCCLSVYERMEAYDNFNAAKAMIRFVDALSNWYVRRSRERFWKPGMDDDKKSAYATLHECLVTLSKLLAPFTPFLAESMYQNLVRTHDPDAPQSVHLCDYPISERNKPDIESRVDENLNAQATTVRQLVSCGRAARSAAQIRVRQPLACIELCHRQPDVIQACDEIIRQELNIKRIDYVSSAEIDKYVEYELKPDFKKIGPKHGKLAPKIKAALAKHGDVESLVKAIEQDGRCAVTVDGQSVELSADEVLVELHAKEGFSAERIPGCGILALDTHITPELADEGIARDLINQIQQARKQLDLRYEQRIDLAVVGNDEIRRVVNAFAEYIRGETLAQSLLNQEIPGVAPTTADIDDHKVNIYVKPL